MYGSRAEHALPGVAGPANDAVEDHRRRLQGSHSSGSLVDKPLNAGENAKRLSAVGHQFGIERHPTVPTRVVDRLEDLLKRLDPNELARLQPEVVAWRPGSGR